MKYHFRLTWLGQIRKPSNIGCQWVVGWQEPSCTATGSANSYRCFGAAGQNIGKTRYTPAGAISLLGAFTLQTWKRHVVTINWIPSPGNWMARALECDASVRSDGSDIHAPAEQGLEIWLPKRKMRSTAASRYLRKSASGTPALGGEEAVSSPWGSRLTPTNSSGGAGGSFIPIAQRKGHCGWSRTPCQGLSQACR